jgi:cytochrome c peroxidase
MNRSRNDAVTAARYIFSSMYRTSKAVLVAIARTVPVSPRRRYRGVLAGLTLLIAGATAVHDPVQVPEAPRSATSLFADEEPITPIPQPPAADPRKLALGERLFEDPRLSGNGTRACVSCHDTRTNGASRNRHDLASDGTELHFNTSTIFNAALSFRFNWEGNFRTLEAEAAATLENPSTMGAAIDDVVRRLNADPEMARRFDQAYGHRPDRASLLDAIVTYERSLLTPGSRFDRWLGGETTALSAEEQNGYRLFKTLGCISCHQGVNVGGNLLERYGIFLSPVSAKSQMLRVPSLRNVAATPPYFHDGDASTLEEAVRRMGKAQLNQTLSDQQTTAIVAFLKTLTGTYRGHPVTGPSQ